MNTKMEYYIDNFELTKKGDNRAIMYGEWSIFFGRTTGKIFNREENLLFSIKKKVNIWKLKVNYHVKDINGKSFEIVGKNKRLSIYEMKIEENKFELKLHKGNKKSFFKNGTQISYIDETVFRSKTIIVTRNEENLAEIFLMLFCLKIGEDNDGITFNLGNIGKMEPIDEEWKP